jgi:Family of unknown function (DUF6499)
MAPLAPDDYSFRVQRIALLARISAMATDWHDASAYDYFDDLDASGLAWECLRRNPRYRAGFPMMDLGLLPAGEWGLRFPGRP